MSSTARRAGAYLAVAGAVLGSVVGVVELALGPQIRSWVGGKQDTTRLGLATIALSAIALVAAVTWWRRQDASPSTQLLILVGLIVPALLCFTTAGRAWYVPGILLVLAAATAASDLRADAPALLETISRNWLAGLTAILAALYVFLGATAPASPAYSASSAGSRSSSSLRRRQRERRESNDLCSSRRHCRSRPSPGGAS